MFNGRFFDFIAENACASVHDLLLKRALISGVFLHELFSWSFNLFLLGGISRHQQALLLKSKGG